MLAGTLEIQMLAQMARLSKDMADAKRVVGGAMQDIQRVVGLAQRALGSLGLGFSLSSIIKETERGEQSINRLNAVIRATGNASGFTQRELHALADELKGITQFDDEGLRDAISSLLKFGNLSNDTLKRALAVSADFAAFMKTDVSSAAETLGRAIAAPSQGVERLQRSIGYLDPALVAMIKSMEASGDVLGAQAKLLEVVEGKIGGVAQAMNTGLTKALADVRKEWGDFEKAIGNSALMKTPTETVLGGVATTLRTIRGIFEAEAWLDRAFRFFNLVNAGGRLFGLNPSTLKPESVGSGDPAAALKVRLEAERKASAEHAAEIRKQDDDLIKWQLEQKKKRDEELKREAERLRQEDIRGWIAHAEAVFQAAEENDRAMAAIHADYWKNEERMRQLDVAGWIAYIEAKKAADNAALIAFAATHMSQIQIYEEEQKRAAEASASAWSDLVGRVIHGFSDMRSALKSFARDLIALFAKKYFLQMIAGVTGSASLTATAGQVGTGTAAGAAASWLGGVTGVSGFAEGVAMGFRSGVAAPGVISEAIGAFMASPAGWVVGGVLAIGLLAAALSKPRGGPKDEGQFTGMFGADGRLTGTAGNAFNIVGTSANPAAQEFATGMGGVFVQTLARFGITPQAFQYGVGIVRDPRGTAPTFVDTVLRDSSGRELFRQHNDQVGRSDSDLEGELKLQGMRAILAAVKASELPPMLASVFSDLLPSSATLAEIEAAFTEAERLQAMWSGFQEAFATDAEKLGAATTKVTDGFRALGIDVPKDVETFKALVKQAWESGDKDLFNALIALAPAFKFVADEATSAAEKIKAQWMDVNDAIDKILGRDRRPGQLGDMMGQLGATDAMFGGLDLRGLAALVAGFTSEQWEALTDSQRELITSILRLGATMDTAAEAISTAVQTIVFPEVESQGLIGNFFRRYSGLTNAAPDKMSGLTLTAQLITDQISQWEAQMKGLSPYSTEYQTLAKAIEDLRQVLGLTTADIAALTILEAQYGKEKGEQLFGLQKWYDEQRALIGDNLTALLALDEWYVKERNAIIEGGIADGLESAREQLRGWLDSLLLNNQLSPLSPMDQLTEATRQYEDMLERARGGDLGAIQGLSGAADVLLRIARQIFGSSSAYNAIFRDVFDAVGGVAGSSLTFDQRMIEVLPTNGRLASSSDIGELRDAVHDLIAMIAQGITVNDPEATAATERVVEAVEAIGADGMLT